MTPEQTALARSRTYALIGEILLDGWTDRALAVVRGLPWAADLPDDPDQRAARHQQVFGRTVPPYESVFRSPDGLLGGPIAGELRDQYARIGFRPTRTDIEPDHAGLQCLALSFLCAAEADARRDGVPAPPIEALQKELLGAHLGRWVHPLRIAVSRQGVGELTELVALLADLVDQHGPVTAASDPAPTPDLLADPKTGLKDLAAFLLVPARSGIWLGTDDIQRIAERAQLACGFSKRKQMLESLFFSAVDHERVPELCSALNEELDAWETGDSRVASTRAMLGQVAAAARAPSTQ